MITKSEIFKAAHRQAARLVCPGVLTYRQAFARALSEMAAFAREPVAVGQGYAALSCVTLSRGQRELFAA